MARGSNAQTKMINNGNAQEQQQTMRQYAEQTAVAQEDTSQRHRELLIEQGRLQAIGAESGLAGVTNDRIVSDAGNQGDRDIATISANRLRQQENAHSQGTAKQSSANIQLASIKRPSDLGAGLQIGAAAVSAYSSYKAPVPPKDKP